MGSRTQNWENKKRQAELGVLDGYLHVFDDLPLLIRRSEVDGNCNYINHGWSEFTGRSFEQEKGEGWMEGIHPEDLARTQNVLVDCYKEQQPFQIEYRLRNSQGEYYWFQDNGKPIRNSDGSFEGFVNVCFDQTERMGIEKTLVETNQALTNSSTALSESEAMFQSLFHYSPDAIIAVDQQGKIVLANHQAEILFGYSQQEMIGQSIEILIPASYQGRHKQHVKKYISNPHVRPMGSALSLLGQRKDGSRFPVDINLGPVVTEKGSMVLATIRDTTERKKAEEAILERETLLTVAASSAPIIFFKIDRDGFVRLSVGESLSRKLNNIEPVGRSIKELYPNHPHIIECVERALAGETVTAVIDTNGQTFEATYVPLKSEQGEVNSVLGFAVDVTRHRKVEGALLESEAHFRTVFNDAIEGIKLLDPNGKIIKANPALEEMLGYSAEELLTMSYSDMTYSEDVPLVRSHYDQLFAGKKDHFRIEKRYIHKDGHILWGRLAMSLVRDPAGTPLYSIGMVENINAQKQAEAELAELQRRLIDSAEIERLNLSQELHDGPLQDLQAMGFQVSMLQSMIEDPAGLEELRAIDEELRKVVHSIRSICGDLRPPALTPFGLEKTIRSHADRFQTEHPEIQIDLDLMSDGKALPERVRLALFRIYQHSMVNIIRHANAKKVKIAFHFDNNNIELKIVDDGTGFRVPRRWIELVRQEHFGLVGSIERAESIGGKMDIQSSPGSGTAITVTVPRREEEQVTAKERFTNNFAFWRSSSI